MRTVLVTTGFMAAILSLILAVTPLFKIAYLPSVAALVLGVVAFYFAKHKQWPKKSIHLLLLLTGIALFLATYKTIFNTVEVGNTEALIQKEQESEQEALEILEDIELDE